MGSGWQGLASLGAGVSGGVLSGLFGIGGGIVLIPLLGLVLGLDQHQAQGVALAAMLLPNGLPAVLYMRRMGILIHWALVLDAHRRVPARGLAGGPDRQPDPGNAAAAGLRLLLLAAGRADPAPAGAGQRTRPSAAPLALDRAWLPGLAIGLLGGLASGLLGIGGGILMIPLMVWLAAAAPARGPDHQPGAHAGPHRPARGCGSTPADSGLPWLALGGVAVGFLAGAYGGARIALGSADRACARASPCSWPALAVLLLPKG